MYDWQESDERSIETETDYVLHVLDDIRERLESYIRQRRDGNRLPGLYWSVQASLVASPPRGSDRDEIDMQTGLFPEEIELVTALIKVYGEPPKTWFRRRPAAAAD